MRPDRQLLIATATPFLWAPPVVGAVGEPELVARPSLTSGLDLLTAVLAVRLAVVAAVAAAGF